MKKIQVVFLVCILFLGIGLRSIEVINKNFLFGFDQGRDYLDVRKIVVEKKPTLIGPEVGAGAAGISGIFHGPYYYYSLVLPFLIFQGNPYGGLVLMFCFGVASLFICFFFIKKAFGINAALVATLLLGVALSAQSRFMWNSHPSTLLILLTLWFTYKTTKNQKYFFMSTLFAGFIYGFQLAISVALIFSLFLFAFLFLKIRNLKVYLRGLVGAVLAYSPFILFELRHGFMAVKGIIVAFAKFFSGESQAKFWPNLIDHLWSFWYNYRNTFLLSGRLPLFLSLFLLTLIIFSIVKVKTSPKKKFLYFLIILPVTTFAILLFLNNTVWGHYLIHLHLTYILIFSIYFGQAKSPIAKTIFLIFLILMLPGIIGETKRAYNDLDDYGGIAKIKGKIEAVDYIYQDAGDQNFNVLVFTPPVYDYAYRYLLDWYGEKKYGFVPGQEKKGLFYLWIEPDPGKPWSYQGWLETKIKIGTVLQEVNLPSGFIIQKRYFEEN